MKNKSLIITIVLICAGLFTYGQTRVNGQVISAANRQPIANASITLLGKNIGTITNDDGLFSLTAPITTADSLIISSIGYQPKKTSLSRIKANKPIVINLEPMVQQLHEVAIIPLTLQQLLDSITRHNQKMFLNPMKLTGYYREFAFVNDKCTEYADALTTYFGAGKKLSDYGLLKIDASRCSHAKINNAATDFDISPTSVVPPTRGFEFAMLYGLLDKYLPASDLKLFKYKMERVENSDDLVITIFPKPPVTTNKAYKIIFNLTGDFTLRSSQVEIPRYSGKLNAINQTGMYITTLERVIEVKYEYAGSKIYPKYFLIDASAYMTGNFNDRIHNQVDRFKSEYVTTGINVTNPKPVRPSEAYKMGNICSNGVAINDSLLKAYNFIPLSRKDSLEISGLK